MRPGRWLMAGALGSLGLALLMGGTLCLSSGCSSVGYLARSAQGHLSLLGAARPVDQWLADEATPAPLKERLALTQRIRDYAIQELALPDNRSYRAYADIGRPAAVWNVVAAPELSLTLKTWCFPVVGCVSYRGHFEQDRAEAEAAALRAEGWEASAYAVPAYSTLGWSEWVGGDPLLSSFIQWPEGELARLIFHELSHQVAYAEGDTVFNESYATAVERLGGERWLATRASAAARAQYAAFDQRRRELREITLAARQRLQAVYAGPGPDEDKRRAKAEAMAALRDAVERAKRERWGGYAGFDAYVARLNNATLGVQGAYLDRVPAFEALFEREGRSFARFHAAVRRLAAQPRAERDAALDALAPLASRAAAP